MQPEMPRRGWAVVDEWDQVLLETKSFEQAFRFHCQMAPWVREKQQTRIVPPSELLGTENQLMTFVS